jgi:hypothetical protein
MSCEKPDFRNVDFYQTVRLLVVGMSTSSGQQAAMLAGRVKETKYI